MAWRQLCATAAMALFALGGFSGQARAEGRKIKAEIPFAFQAGKHSLPAGTYLFEHMAARPVLVITAPDGDRIAVLTHPAGRMEAPAAPGLVFEREDGRYSLAEVWAPGAAHRAGVLPSKRAGPVASSRQRVRIVASLSEK
ncbi:MAG: hypothetical protein ACOYX1_02930 [Acidobacteriota bacterium]